MAKKTKTVNLRLYLDDINYLLDGFKGINPGVKFCVGVMRAIQGESLLELEGFFSSEEWIYLAYLLKREENRKIEPSTVCSKNELCRLILDARNLVAYASYCQVVPHDMARRIRAQLNASHIIAIWTRVWNFWEHNEGVDIHEWAEF